MRRWGGGRAAGPVQYRVEGTQQRPKRTRCIVDVDVEVAVSGETVSCCGKCAGAEGGEVVLKTE